MSPIPTTNKYMIAHVTKTVGVFTAKRSYV